MKNKKDNFNLDLYIEENEGLIQKFTKSKLYNLCSKFFKFKLINIAIGHVLAIAAIIIGAWELYIQSNTSDSGATIERIYQEIKTDITELQKQIKMVELPDSLENTREVQELRLLQNKILKYLYVHSSVFTHIKNNEVTTNYLKLKNNLHNDKKIDKEIVARYVENIEDLKESTKNICHLQQEIIKDIRSSIVYFKVKKDSTTLCTIYMSELRSILDYQNRYDTLLSSKNKDLEEISKKINKHNIISCVMESLKIAQSTYTCEEFQDLYNSFRHFNTKFLYVINIRLLNIKNEAIKKTFTDNPQ